MRKKKRHPSIERNEFETTSRTIGQYSSSLLVSFAVFLGSCTLFLGPAPSSTDADADAAPDSDADQDFDGATRRDADVDHDEAVEDADVELIIDADQDDEANDADVDAEADADEGGVCVVTSLTEICSSCTGESCDGNCSDEDCDGYSESCPGSEAHDERVEVEPLYPSPGESVVVTVTSVNHAHGCYFMECEPPPASSSPTRRLSCDYARIDDTNQWNCTTAADGRLDEVGDWVCTFFSKTDVNPGTCDGGNTLAQACAIVHVVL